MHDHCYFLLAFESEGLGWCLTLVIFTEFGSLEVTFAPHVARHCPHVFIGNLPNLTTLTEFGSLEMTFEPHVA